MRRQTAGCSVLTLECTSGSEGLTVVAKRKLTVVYRLFAAKTIRLFTSTIGGFQPGIQFLAGQ